MLNEEMEISAASITDRWSLLDDAPPFQDSEVVRHKVRRDSERSPEFCGGAIAQS